MYGGGSQGEVNSWGHLEETDINYARIRHQLSAVLAICRNLMALAGIDLGAPILSLGFAFSVNPNPRKWPWHRGQRQSPARGPGRLYCYVRSQEHGSFQIGLF